ncbi:MAG TPA: hypothetical protein VIN59_02930 [Alphaproteobacteria bacterium]
MQGIFAASGFLRPLVANLLLCVFIALSFLPVGFMPDFSHDGISVKLCSGLDEKIALLGDDGQPIHHDNQNLCAFGLNVNAAPAVQPILVAAPLYTAPVYTARHDLILSRIAATAYASRAPPITL